MDDRIVSRRLASSFPRATDLLRNSADCFAAVLRDDSALSNETVLNPARAATSAIPAPTLRNSLSDTLIKNIDRYAAQA